MKEFWSGRIRGLTPYTPGEQPKDRQFIKLNTNENPYPPSPRALEAIRAAAGEGLRLYPDPEGAALRQALAELHGLRAEQVFVGNGSDEVLAMCFMAFFDRELVFPDVSYSFYPVYADLFHIPYREIPLDGEFGVDVADYLGNNGGVVLANPNAPTGRALPLSDIVRLLEGNPDVAVLVDEAYVDFGGASAVELIGSHPNLVVVRTMSKSRSLAGLRVGYALGSETLIAALNCVKDSFNSYTLDRLALAGAEASVRDAGYFRATLEKVVRTREWAAQRLAELGFRVCPSAANFLFASHERVDAKTLLDGLRARGILVRWWDKPRIRNYLRITVGTDAEMEALCEALSTLTAEG